MSAEPEKAGRPDTGDASDATGAEAGAPAVGGADSKAGRTLDEPTTEERRDEPTVPVDPWVKNLWSWGKGYVNRFSWAVAPMWLTDTRTGFCYCLDGEACPTPGKHLVSGLGVAHAEHEIERVWRPEDPRVRDRQVGVAVMTGSDSGVVVLDVTGGFELTRARFGLGGGHILTQQTPRGGQHWFFKLPPAEAIRMDRSEVELVTGVLVLGDGGFCALEPRTGYKIVGGRHAIDRGVTALPDSVRTHLMNARLIDSKATIHHDEPWRTRPGQPIINRTKRSYNRDGDLRRLVDEHGDKITLTPGLSFRVWTELGWGDAERAEMDLKRYARDLPRIHRREAAEYEASGQDDQAKRARKWAERSASRASGGLLSDLAGDERIWVSSADEWDNQGWIVGLPVRAGIGRLVNLCTGEIERDAMKRRVSKYLGADYEPGSAHPAGALKKLWDLGAEGGPGRWFVKYVSDLESQYGPEFVRLLQRAAGASLYGRRGVSGDTDAVFVLKGPPRCGKSTFSECLLAVSGKYGKAMSHNLLFGDKGNPEFVDAAIYGFRVLTFSEPPLNAPLNTTKLKSLSGGDSITGRLPYGRAEVSFLPEVSLWLSTNHALEVSDEAVWRRMKFFQFERSWEGADEVPELRRAVTQDPEELKLALAWMLVGSEAWAAGGWGDTTYWGEATEDEKSKHDVKIKWAGECLVVTGDPGETFLPADLMTSFYGWLVMSGEQGPALSKTALRDEMENLVKRQGCVWDKFAKVFRGGRLV